MSEEEKKTLAFYALVLKTIADQIRKLYKSEEERETFMFYVVTLEAIADQMMRSVKESEEEDNGFDSKFEA